jgi:hypothetical protein
LCDIYYWHGFHPLDEHVDSDEQKPEPFWCRGKDAHDVDSPNCEWLGEINGPKRIVMIHCLLLKELTILALGDGLHRIVLSRVPVESMSKCFADD